MRLPHEGGQTFGLELVFIIVVREHLLKRLACPIAPLEYPKASARRPRVQHQPIAFEGEPPFHRCVFDCAFQVRVQIWTDKPHLQEAGAVMSGARDALWVTEGPGRRTCTRKTPANCTAEQEERQQRSVNTRHDK